jgi:hypothetical protein
METEEKLTFYKFPKTVHLEGSSVVDEDESVNFSILKSITSSSRRIILQEKVDGANVSVYFREDDPWQPIMQKRSGILGTHEKAQYDVFR